ERLQGHRALVLSLDASEDTVGLQIPHRGHRYARRRQGPRQTTTEVDASQHVLLLGVEVANGPAQPAFIAHLVRLAGVPNIHGAEVRATRVGITNSLNNRYLPLVIELLDRTHGGMKPNSVIDRQYLIFGDADFWPVITVQGVAVRDHGIQAVVAPG